MAVGLRLHGGSAAVAALPTDEQRRGGAPLSAQLVIGTGVKCEAYYSPQIIFKDAFKQSQPFWHQQNDSHWPDGEATPFDPATAVSNTNGYPNQDPPSAGWWKTHMRASLGGNYESGTYKVFFDGDATVEVKGDTGGAWAAVTNGGSITVTAANEGIHLRLSGIVTPPTFIHVVPVAYEGDYLTDPFHPTWVASAGHYKVIRWMDSCGVASELSVWANRTVIGSQTQTPKLNRGAAVTTEGGYTTYWQDEWGMAIEHMVDFCNKVGADIYLCLPPKCTDDYVTQLCTLVHGRLNANLKLYLEYGNEDWNNTMAGSVWMAIQTNTNNAVQFPWGSPLWSHLTQGAALNARVGALGMFYQAWRGSQCMQLARAAFGTSAPSRLVRVFGCQTADSWTFDQAFRHLGLHVNFDAVAPNFYWGHNEATPWGADMATWKAYCLWKLGESGVDRAADATQDVATHYGESMGDHLRRIANTIRSFGKRIIGYEAGQHVVPTDAGKVTEWSAVQNDAIMRDVYLQMMRVWLRICGSDSPFLHYVDVGGWGTPGTWGSRTTIADVTSKKYLAMKDVATGTVML